MADGTGTAEARIRPSPPKPKHQFDEGGRRLVAFRGRRAWNVMTLPPICKPDFPSEASTTSGTRGATGLAVVAVSRRG